MIIEMYNPRYDNLLKEIWNTSSNNISKYSNLELNLVFLDIDKILIEFKNLKENYKSSYESLETIHTQNWNNLTGC